MGIWGKIFGDESDAQPKNFQVTFNAHKLGMTLAAASDGTPVVTKVAGGGAAAKANIQAGDTVLSVNGEGPLRYEELLLAINTPRPTNLMFCRVGGTMNPLQRAQEAAQRKIQEMQGKEYQPPPPAMTEEKKRERREAALKAAEGRTKDWGKKINKGREETKKRTSTTNGVRENQFEESGSVETRRQVQLAKEKEEKTAASMGYNPYQARMVGNTTARAVISGIEGSGAAGVPIPETISSPPTTTATTTLPTMGAGHVVGTAAGAKQTPATRLFEGKEALLADKIGAEIEEALGLVLEQGSAVSLVAVQTMLKMMKNMSMNKGEDKFKRVRIANANFNSKVGEVNGGIEVMTAAGYVLKTDEEEAYLQHGSCDPVPLRLRVAIFKLGQAEKMLTSHAG